MNNDERSAAPSSFPETTNTREEIEDSQRGLVVDTMGHKG